MADEVVCSLSLEATDVGGVEAQQEHQRADNRSGAARSLHVILLAQNVV